MESNASAVLGTPMWKLLAGLATLLVLAAISPLWPRAEFLGFCALVFPWRRLRLLARTSRYKVLRSLAVARRLSRRLDLNPLAELAYWCTFGLLTVSALAQPAAASSSTAWGVLFYVAASLFALVALLDWWSILAKLAKHAWAKIAWRFGMGCVVAIAACVSRAIARDVVVELVHADPKNFQATADLLTLVIAPSLVFAVFTFSIAALGLTLFLGVSCWRSFIEMPLLPFLAEGIFGRQKRPLPRSRTMLNGKSALHFRALGPLAIATVVIGFPSEAMQAHRVLVDQALRNLIVQLDFYPALGCEMAPNSARIVHMDSEVMVAILKDGSWTFARGACTVAGR
jgi:hypothetical protein